MNQLSRDDIQQLSNGQLISLINRGILGVMNATPYPIQTMASKTDTPEYRKYAHLAGTSIGIGEAARKYDIPHQSISRWVKKGLIAKLGTGPNRMVMIDEADIAYCAAIAHTRPGGQGRWLFNPDGSPYIPES